MELLQDIVSRLNSLVWGPVMLVLILGTGTWLMIGLRGMPVRSIGQAFRLLLAGRKPDSDKGEISPFQALMTSLSATIGTGNIAGVATAIALGGPGALFWMWCTALVGMATKYAEAVCAVKFREVNDDGSYSGGPMYYIKNGLAPHWHWLGTSFAIFGALAGFGIGNSVQANSVADAIQSSFGVAPEWTGVGMMVCVGLVILGGVKRIAEVAGFLVPFMAIAYLAVGIAVLLMNVAEIPAAVATIVSSAFTGTAATGGFAGAAVWAALRFGVARGIFSNEAGLGSAPIAHAAARTNDPVNQGMVAMLGTFIDTLIVCSVTGLVIVITGVWTTGESGASLSAAAYNAVLPGGEYIVSVGLVLFAFTTMLGWSYYSERCVVYLMGTRVVPVFRLLWVGAIYLGAVAQLGFVWLVADTLNALMALPNLLALLLLSPVIFRITRNHLAQPAAEGAQ